jgi:hypothetical protein
VPTIPLPRLCTALAAVSAAALLALPYTSQAQRRPGVGTGFYTYTGLLSTDIEAGSVTGTTAFAEGPTVAASVLVSTALKKLTRKAVIVGLRGTALSLGNNDGCYIVAPSTECQNRRFTERLTLLPGMAWDIRESLLRVTGGPTLFSVEGEGLRLGTQLRVDFARPRQTSTMPTIFLSRSFLGSQRGRGVGFTTLGIGYRFAQKK